MNNKSELISKVTPLKYNKISLETSLGRRYSSDLSFFQKVHCYPKIVDWEKVSIDKDSLGLSWSSKFKVTLSQIKDSAFKVEDIKSK